MRGNTIPLPRRMAITVRILGDTTVVGVAGELDAAVADDLRRHLLAVRHGGQGGASARHRSSTTGTFTTVATTGNRNDGSPFRERRLIAAHCPSRRGHAATTLQSMESVRLGVALIPSPPGVLAAVSHPGESWPHAHRPFPGHPASLDTRGRRGYAVMAREPEPQVSLDRLRAAVGTALRERTDVLDPLARLCRACARLLPVDGASISLMTRDGTGHRETLFASDAIVDHIETLQFSLGEGPCFEAFTTGRPVLVADLAADAATAWPVFAAQMADQPVGAIFAFPLVRGAARVGAIDLYRRTPGWLTPPDLAIALQVADIAATALIGPLLHDPDLDAVLAGLPHHREHIHQATGILIAEHAIPADQALARLRGYAFATGRLVDEVATDLVGRRMHPREISE